LTIRNSKLTLTNRLHISWSATVPCNTAFVPPLSGTRMLWSEKTTVCRIFSCQRPALGSSAPNLLTSGGSGAPPKQRSTKPSPDVGVRETHQPHSLTETFSNNPAQVRLRDDAIGLIPG